MYSYLTHSPNAVFILPLLLSLNSYFVSLSSKCIGVFVFISVFLLSPFSSSFKFVDSHFTFSSSSYFVLFFSFFISPGLALSPNLHIFFLLSSLICIFHFSSASKFILPSPSHPILTLFSSSLPLFPLASPFHLFTLSVLLLPFSSSIIKNSLTSPFSVPLNYPPSFTLLPSLPSPYPSTRCLFIQPLYPTPLCNPFIQPFIQRPFRIQDDLLAPLRDPGCKYPHQ